MKSIVFLTTFISILFVTPAFAAKYANRYYDNHHDEHIAFARVINVHPIYKKVKYRNPMRQCHYKDHTIRRKHSHTPVIVGSLIGGAIGNELGHNKTNKRVGAVAGAILGGSIAHDISHKKGHRTITKKVCTHKARYKKEVTGYNVTYKYRGRILHTRMKQHPGKRIKVAVNVQPLNY